MSTTGPTQGWQRISPEQLAAAERTRQYWAGRRLLIETSEVPARADLGVDGDGADEDAETTPVPTS